MPRCWLLLLSALAVIGSGAPLPGDCRAAGPPEYTIAELFALGRRSGEIRFARVFEDHAIIRSASYRVPGSRVGHYYFHPEFGPRIRTLLRDDTFVSLPEIDRFLRNHLASIERISLYREGFILVQLVKPESVLIVPVSLVTVARAEQALKSYLKLEP